MHEQHFDTEVLEPLAPSEVRRDMGHAESRQDLLDVAEARQKALVDEVNHRVKNTLATVQALARYTLRGAGVSPAVRRDFEGRLLALSSVHNQLAQERWAGAELGLVIRDLLTPYELDERVYLDGPPVWLPPNLAIALAMALQELLANAERHGALSLASGHVALDWRVKREGDTQDWLCLDWRENGGPAVHIPSRRGLGSELIDHAVREELGGSVRLDFATDGLHCRLSVPLPDARG
jgi:two-component sensor histidine kinase